MWIMTSYGILMPAALPTDVLKRFWNEWNENERSNARPWTLQVRSRDRKTLVKARKRMRAMTYDTSPIVATPDLDYDFRFYCMRNDFAELIRFEVTEIDYEKFKPTTLRKGGGGQRLHNLYNRIWGVVASHYEAPILQRYQDRKREQKKSWWDDVHPWDNDSH